MVPGLSRLLVIQGPIVSTSNSPRFYPWTGVRSGTRVRDPTCVHRGPTLHRPPVHPGLHGRPAAHTCGRSVLVALVSSRASARRPGHRRLASGSWSSAALTSLGLAEPEPADTGLAAPRGPRGSRPPETHVSLPRPSRRRESEPEDDRPLCVSAGPSLPRRSDPGPAPRRRSGTGARPVCTPQGRGRDDLAPPPGVGREEEDLSRPGPVEVRTCRRGVGDGEVIKEPSQVSLPAQLLRTCLVSARPTTLLLRLLLDRTPSAS